MPVHAVVRHWEVVQSILCRQEQLYHSSLSCSAIVYVRKVKKSER